MLAYRGLAALRDYLLLAQDRPRVEIYRRTEDGGWRYEVHEQGALALDCGPLKLHLTLADLYEDLVW